MEDRIIIVGGGSALRAGVSDIEHRLGRTLSLTWRG
jgi:hypothetical protein